MSSLESIHDSLKALEEVRQDAEKGMFMFDGAIKLLCKQEEDCIRTGQCAVCHRGLTSKLQLQECTRMLQQKREGITRVRNDEAVALHDSCIQAMNELTGGNSGQKQIANIPSYPSLEITAYTPHLQRAPSSARLAFYVRTGELSEWRQQKLDCMTTMSCFACERRFTAEEFSSFLKRVDHRAAVMERELHIHPKFCPIYEEEEETKTQDNDSSTVMKTARRGRWGQQQQQTQLVDSSIVKKVKWGPADTTDIRIMNAEANTTPMVVMPLSTTSLSPSSSGRKELVI
jgi:hypothetical protein